MPEGNGRTFDDREKSKEAHSIRYSPDEWQAFEAFAGGRGMPTATLVRHASIMGMKVMQSISELEHEQKGDRSIFPSDFEK